MYKRKFYCDLIRFHEEFEIIRHKIAPSTSIVDLARDAAPCENLFANTNVR